MKAHFGPAFRPLLPVAAVFALGLSFSAPAQAVDGCKVLLCMAGNWQRISECVPTVREALRDIVRGRAWPTCAMGGSSASSNQGVAAVQCPLQYRRIVRINNAGHPVYACPYSGVIHIAIEGQPWSRTWWSMSGDTVIEWLPAARAALASYPGSMDDRFEREYAAWVYQQQNPPEVDPGNGG